MGGSRRKKIADAGSEERFLRELCGYLKFPSVRKLLAEMDSQDLTEWRAMYRVGAFGSRAEDQRAGVIAAAAGNAPRFRKSNGDMWTPADHFQSLARPRSKEERAKETAGRLRAWRRVWTGK